jgi:hypothetical protein
LLAEFASVVDAVRCAAEVQRGMLDRAPEVADERRIKFRIGINLGDVIAEGGDIFGDGVNAAARLEALAELGGICISRTVRDQIRDKLAYALEDKGEQIVKNIARPVRVYALRPEAIAATGFDRVPRRVNRAALSGLRVGDRVERPDRAADFREELGGVDLRAQGAGVDEHDLTGDRLERGSEMLHRLDRDGAVPGRVDAQ